MAANVRRVEVVLHISMRPRFLFCICFIFSSSLESLKTAQADISRNTNGTDLQNLMLAIHPDCQEDVNNYCTIDSSKSNNLDVLNCLQRDLETMNKVSDPCQQLIWMYKESLTKDGHLESAANARCNNFFSQIPECSNLETGTGHRIPCLIENMNKLNTSLDEKCRVFLYQIANIVFGDYRLISHFVENCNSDIKKFSCGRLPGDANKLHAQGKTIQCLAKNFTLLDPTCKKQVLRVAELQSDDYHLDRSLYYACREAREYLCPGVRAGGGKVFDCLFKNKIDPRMPPECRKLLTVRQKLIAEDVKVEKTFFTACQADIGYYKCIAAGETTDGHAARSKILLCLESAMQEDGKVDPLCVAKMAELRRTLLEDYQITPEIVNKCDQEIESFCKTGEDFDKSGRTIHCLMENANPRATLRLGRQFAFRDQCKTAIEHLLKEADVAQDYTIDEVLSTACQEVLSTECQNVEKSGVLNCLMEKIDSDHMTDECEDKLLEIQYFIVRDFKLDPGLFKRCHKDAVKLCGVSEHWSDMNRQTVENTSMIFSCLYRHIQEKEISKGCEHEVKRVMKQRAKRISLEPEIEDACLRDLGIFCSELQHYEKGMEMSCLQDNLDSLTIKCQDKVREFTEEEDEDLDLDTVLMRACTPMIKKFCDELLHHNAEASEVMDCLIENKNHHEMNDKCLAGIEHHQLIQLKDYKFSHKFREACKRDISKLCSDKHNKTDIVACLSEKTRDDILKEDKFQVSAKCRNQLTVELLRREENIDLDPELKANCKESIAELCKDKRNDNAEMIECLKDHQRELTSSCHRMIFKRELDETLLSADYVLFRECKTMIKKYCPQMDNSEVLECLQHNRNKALFDNKCKAVVMKRRLQETKDYRLNPKLARNCRADISSFCHDILANRRKAADPMEEFEGQITNCLKKQYIKKKLSSACSTEIHLLVQDTHLDIKLDPILMHACEDEIKRYCSTLKDEIMNDVLVFRPSDDGDKIEQCLQDKLKEGKIIQTSSCAIEIIRFIEEAHIDINIDPQLYEACQADLLKWCQDVDIGLGKKMSCLLSVLEHPDKLKPKCNSLLAKRKALWGFAAEVAPAESLAELSNQVLSSPAKTYLLGMLFSIVGVIFIVGITCGYVTKRVSKDQKNK